ncbi:MAG: elongation factor Ts [Clostridia bacterium]|nr:elongation factor Ts [Clostridia bacterium]
MNFTAKDVQMLRERTGVGMMDCKKALAASDGDTEKAIQFLREKGIAAAAKKSGRIAAEGTVSAFCGEDVGAMVEVNSETDFVAKNPTFQEFALNVATVVAKENPADVEQLLACRYDDKMTVQQALQDRILVIGENLTIRRFVRFEGKCVSYIHGAGRIGVLVKLAAEGADEEAVRRCGKEVAMQVAALNAAYLDKSVVPASALEEEKEVLMAQIKNDPKMANKPDAIIAKMVEGRIGKYYENNCLMQQAFAREPEITVGAFVERTSKEAGGRITILDYARFERGEGLQKREDNLAAEIAKMTQQK